MLPGTSTRPTCPSRPRRSTASTSSGSNGATHTRPTTRLSSSSRRSRTARTPNRPLRMRPLAGGSSSLVRTSTSTPTSTALSAHRSSAPRTAPPTRPRGTPRLTAHTAPTFRTLLVSHGVKSTLRTYPPLAYHRSARSCTYVQLLERPQRLAPHDSSPTRLQPPIWLAATLRCSNLSALRRSTRSSVARSAVCRLSPSRRCSPT
mmetsp:Transcript_86845/g.246021  ORF Transcript_86845/g.246021 Transcript_86845/m.246021 type:complete len:204 (-) Transcript_86845:3834-4445(-)